MAVGSRLLEEPSPCVLFAVSDRIRCYSCVRHRYDVEIGNCGRSSHPVEDHQTSEICCVSMASNFHVSNHNLLEPARILWRYIRHKLDDLMRTSCATWLGRGCSFSHLVAYADLAARPLSKHVRYSYLYGSFPAANATDCSEVAT